MSDLVVCVPNVSEGRSPSALRRMESAIKASPAHVLDTHSDEDHHRSVFTFAAPLTDVAGAVLRLAEAAFECIDITRHRGVHPRVGALDVVPLIPFAETGREACIDCVGEIADRLWAEFRVPSYLYGYAARREDRTRLETIRKHGYGAISEAVRRGECLPDIGGPELHPKAGACFLGVRDFMAAFNVQLADHDATAAKRIARAVRESSGGLPGVKALGLFLPSQNSAQVSMNVTQLDLTPLDTVFAAVCRESAALGVDVLGSELVGLVPRNALGPEPERLRIRGFHEGMILETRLARTRLPATARASRPS